MAGTDAYIDHEVYKPELEIRKSIARLRTMLTVNPKECHLFTLGGERWLSDRYVILRVTDEPALKAPLPDHVHDDDGTVEGCPGCFWEPAEIADYGYKLTAGKGLVPDPELMLPNTPALMRSFRKHEPWFPMHRTSWSVADSQAKLMLAYAEIDYADMGATIERQPVAINEGIWAAFEAAFPECRFFWHEGDPYRVVDKNGKVCGYIAKGSLPEGEQGLAQEIVASLGKKQGA